jgi:hypothetical protein
VLEPPIEEGLLDPDSGVDFLPSLVAFVAHALGEHQVNRGVVIVLAEAAEQTLGVAAKRLHMLDGPALTTEGELQRSPFHFGGNGIEVEHLVSHGELAVSGAVRAR